MQQDKYTYKIYPSIGVARVGNSKEFYLAPETAGGLPTMPDGKPFQPTDFRDAQGGLRRQGVRFKVFRESADGKKVEEVTPGKDGISIEWTVHLANKKASWYEFIAPPSETGYSPEHPLRNAWLKDPAERQRQLIIDPGPRSVSGPNQSAAFSRDSKTGYKMSFPPETLKPFSIDTLGDLVTDASGQLIVLGGHGHSGSTEQNPDIGEYANNDYWWDDTADGPVHARITLPGGQTIDATPAWVMVGPPAYAPQIMNLVTLYDTMYDTAVRQMGLRPDMYNNWVWNEDYTPDFETEILPILKRGEQYVWVVAIPPKPHKFDLRILGNPDSQYNSLRQYYMEKLRAPDMPNQMHSGSSGHTMMPYLAGDGALSGNLSTSRYLTFTATQYFLLEQWSKGKFIPRGKRKKAHPGQQLSEAMLENCVGGAFSPGIEMTWISRNPGIYAEPFRLKAKQKLPYPLSLDLNFQHGLEPGDACKFMACPWQADFNECSAQPVVDRTVWWWPAQRPLWVYRKHEKGRWIQKPWVGTDYDMQAPDFLMFPKDLDMVSDWVKLGFVADYKFVTGKKPGGHDPDFVETGREM